MYLIYDTETTRLPQNYHAPLTDFNNWPRVVQIAWQLHDSLGRLLEQKSIIVRPDGWEISPASIKIHGISNERAHQEGKKIKEVLEDFSQVVKKSVRIIGHNITFDQSVMGSEFLRCDGRNPLEKVETIDTMLISTDYCKIPGKRGYKWPNLQELYQKLFDTPFDAAHDAAYDVEATAKCFFALIQKDIILPLLPNPTKPIDKNDIHYEAPSLGKSNFYESINLKHDAPQPKVAPRERASVIEGFANLFVHTEYSVLQSVNRISELIKKAKGNNIHALAITDMGNLHGSFSLVNLCNREKIKPIIGCELHWAVQRTKLHYKKGAGEKDLRYSQIFLAKNETGYKNLSTLSSLGYIEGFYNVPRVDKPLIEKHREGLIVLTGGMRSEIPSLIYHKGKKEGEEAFCYWHKIFKDDFYAQINRNGIEGEEEVNKVILSLAKKYNVKIVATNESYYLNKGDAKFNDILQCIRVGEKISTPIGTQRGKQRKGLKELTYYFKTVHEMEDLFSDIPEALTNIKEICDKVALYDLKKRVELPNFSLPEEFDNQDDYLRHLTYIGAKERYSNLTEDIKERIDFELETIKKTGYPGYFLIVQDFIAEARKMGVSVGPGRGSAAGSVVAYCTKITNIDPLKYNLLFERFLNPERVSLPDIDVDFDDQGRSKVLDYVIKKYGHEQVAQIITFGTLKPKNAIKDCARVYDLPYAESNVLSNLVPETASNLKEAFDKSSQLSELKNERTTKGEILRSAVQLEGNIRNTGIHACGIIIAPEPLINIIPLTKSKDADLLITQFDNKVVEDAGLLKMDFLGLKTLSIISSCIKNIKNTTGKDIDIDKISLNDPATFNLFQKGATIGIFQFESSGMQNYLEQLHPDKLDDLVAMVSLYRPGPMQYLPNFINRKHGKEKVTYDVPEMEDILKETQGITVYQEQVMLLSQKLANFTKGEADLLRKAMGKKRKADLNQLSEKFTNGCIKNGLSPKIINKIWKDWQAFSDYAFNKSHGACYAVLSFQTAYLKANYPLEFMSSLLSLNLSKKDKLSGFIEECVRMNIKIYPPDVNTSFFGFHINKKNKNQQGIYFGFGAIKGFGEKLSSSLVQEREKNGKFKNIIDFTERLGVKMQKNGFTLLAQVGAFDNIDQYHRKQYLDSANNDGTNYIDTLIKYAERHYKSKNNNQLDLFNSRNSPDSVVTAKPKDCPQYTDLEILNLEKELIGTYLNSHPLDYLKMEYNLVVNTSIAEYKKILNDFNMQNIRQQTKTMSMAGFISGASENVSKFGKHWGSFNIEDFSGSTEIRIFGDDYIKFKNYLVNGNIIHLSSSIAPKYNNPNEAFQKVLKISLLEELVKKKSKCLNLKISTGFASNPMLSRKLLTTLKNLQGETQVYLNITDPITKTQINGLSKRIFVALNTDLLKYLDELKKESTRKDAFFDYEVQITNH